MAALARDRMIAVRRSLIPLAGAAVLLAAGAGTASANPPGLTKTFGAASVAVGGSTTLTFTIANSNNFTLSGIAFTDAFPAGLVIATPNGLTSSCGGTLTAAADTASVSLSGAVVAALHTCSIVLNVVAVTTGSKVNTTSAITSPDGGNGNPATATLNVALISEYPVTTSDSVPYAITTGPDGALWFTEQFGNKIGRITTAGVVTNEYVVPTSGAMPIGITAGPDGALWFTESAGNKIGRITTGGSFAEYTVPTNTSAPQSIVAGPDNALWFTEQGGNKIGRITPGGVVTNEYLVPTSNADTFRDHRGAGRCTVVHRV